MNKAIFWKECLERVVANVFNCLLEVPEVRRKSLITVRYGASPSAAWTKPARKHCPALEIAMEKHNWLNFFTEEIY